MNNKPNIDVKGLRPFTKFLMTIGELPSSYLISMTYEEQLLWFCNYIQNTIIPAVNNNASAVEELQKLFTELQNYVNNYFDNLNVQEEINNKLDEMASDGTLENILMNYVNIAKVFNMINDMKEDTSLQLNQKVLCLGYESFNDGNLNYYTIVENIPQKEEYVLLNNGYYALKIHSNIVEFHAIAKSSATYIIKFPNGKNMIVDTGTANEWASIKEVLDAMNIKFDYGIITHFHVDHVGNLNNILSDYVNENSTWWCQMKPDYNNHREDIADSEERYNNTLAIFTNHNITPIVPENNSYHTIMKDIKLHFLNTSNTIAENYYGQLPEWRDEDTINFNFFSLITEIIHKDVIFLLPGDIERIVEESYYPYLHKCEVMSAPHHLVNRDASLPFYQTTQPKFTLGMHQSDSWGWINSWFKPYIYLDKLNTKFITPKGSTPVNGLFSFFSNGYSVNTTVIGNGNYPDFNHQELVGYFEQLTNYSTQKLSTITLKEILQNLRGGWVFKGVYYGTLVTNFPQLAKDLQSIFPYINTGFHIEMSRPILNLNTAYIKVFDSRRSFTAITYTLNNETTTWRVLGNGNYPTSINGISNLINALRDLPLGHYIMAYHDDVGSVLDTTITYELSVDVFSSIQDTNTLQCHIYGVARYTTATEDKTEVVGGFINTSTNPQYKWYKLN